METVQRIGMQDYIRQLRLFHKNVSSYAKPELDEHMKVLYSSYMRLKGTPAEEKQAIEATRIAQKFYGMRCRTLGVILGRQT